MWGYFKCEYNDKVPAIMTLKRKIYSAITSISLLPIFKTLEVMNFCTKVKTFWTSCISFRKQQSIFHLHEFTFFIHRSFLISIFFNVMLSIYTSIFNFNKIIDLSSQYLNSVLFLHQVSIYTI